jgi:phage baseplate assembly protein W
MAKGVGFYGKDWFSIKEGREIIYESVIRILMTAPGERVMRPIFGAGMRDSLFNLITPDFLQDLAVKIHSALLEFEKRLAVVEVQTDYDEDEGVVRVHVISERTDNPDETETVTFRYNVST